MVAAQAQTIPLELVPTGPKLTSSASELVSELVQVPVPVLLLMVVVPLAVSTLLLVPLSSPLCSVSAPLGSS